MNSNLPTWLQDLGTISSVFGLFVTIFLLLEARKIRNSFLRRARLPEITKELSKTSSLLSSHLKKWDQEKILAIEQFAIIKGLLENLLSKLPDEEKRIVKNYTKKLVVSKSFWRRADLSGITENGAWDLYAEFSTVVTRLEQLNKDIKWD